MKRVKISAGGAVMLAALYFFLPWDMLAALALACAAHEAGHVAAIRLTGGKVTALTLNATGAVISSTPGRTRLAEAVRSLAGPLAGVLYAALAASLGTDAALLSAGFSLALSAWNSLPALPLDGGRAAAALFGPGTAEIISLLTAAAALLCAAALAAYGFGLAPLFAPAALMLCQARHSV